MQNGPPINDDNLVIEDFDDLHLLFQAKRGFYVFYGSQKSTIIAGGIATTKQLAIEKANSEFLERIFAIYQKEKLIIANSNEFSAEDKLLVSNNYKYWINAKSFDEKSEILIPAHHVFLKVPKEKLKNLPVIDGSGLASRKTLDKAKIHGLLEVIERDQICLFWDVKNMSALVVLFWERKISKKIVKFLDRHSYKITVLYLDEFQNDKVHTFIAMLENSDGNITFGSASSLNAISGIERAILEAVTLQKTITIFDQKAIRHKTEVSRSSTNHVLYAHKNPRVIKKYINNKIAGKIDFSIISKNKNEKFNYKNLEKKFRCSFYYYKFPAAPKNQAVVRVIIPTAYRKSNEWPKKKIKNFRLDKYRKRFDSPINKTIPHPYG